MEQIHELLGYKNIKIIQNEDMFKFSLDSILLAHFVTPNYKTKKIIDLGCGNAPIPLFLTLKTKAKIYGVEIQEIAADMAKRSVELNNLQSQIEILNADLKNIYRMPSFANTFDIVVSNPPYFKYNRNSNINKNDFLTIARHEVKVKLKDIIEEAKKLLIDGGSLYLVHRAERLEDIILSLKEENFAVKMLQFVYSKPSSQEALLVLVNAKKNRNPGLKVREPLYVYEENGEYTETVKKIFNFQKKV
ncbi:MAG TPA: tRNA1(Val) (adenine(37)-N6)-methyltransferase [Acholeplasmataceae bacterium]|jgi:tRNA1Val (adenine37-N6)-methyltransferase|nr:tRNA1(Val) (adenine(37)-N6)-methyltransferase [Acholeplasmataceae bacterium]